MSCVLVVIVGLDLAGTINTVISDNECIAAAQCNMRVTVITEVVAHV